MKPGLGPAWREPRPHHGSLSPRELPVHGFLEPHLQPGWREAGTAQPQERETRDLSWFCMGLSASPAREHIRRGKRKRQGAVPSASLCVCVRAHPHPHACGGCARGSQTMPQGLRAGTLELVSALQPWHCGTFPLSQAWCHGVMVSGMASSQSLYKADASYHLGSLYGSRACSLSSVLAFWICETIVGHSGNGRCPAQIFIGLGARTLGEE